MNEIQLIVEQLNQAPFQQSLTLVAFDEKSNFELLELLNDVFKEIDAIHNVDLRDEADDLRAYRYMEFLRLLKYQIPPNVDAFRDGLVNGDRNVIYPILYWALKSLPIHKKRAYLGKYLAPIQVPQEYLGDEDLNEVFLQYKDLQQEFKGLHKQVDQLRNSNIRPGELRREINQLDEEKIQLTEKIAALKRKTANESGFKSILDATSLLRKEQEEQAKLAERKREQQLAFSMAEKRNREFQYRLNELRSSNKETVSADQLFNQVKSQVDQNRNLLSNVLPKEFNNQQGNLHRLDDLLREPPKSENDIANLEDNVEAVKQEIASLNNEIQASQANGSDDKLAIFRQHASVQAKKLMEKEEEYENSIQEKRTLQRQVEEEEAKLSAVSGPKFMKREEFKQYANTLRNKTNQYKKLKAELAEINSETVIIHRTEQILKSRNDNMDEFLKKLEEQNGIVGFIKTQDKLEHVSEMNAKINETKGKTLEDISRIVTDINQTLKERKNKLAPQIKELRSVRQRYQEMEQEYLAKKQQYDNTAVGLETERFKLEQECKAFQEDAIREESRYHYLNCLIDIENAKLEKIKQEIDFNKGSGRLLRDFRSFQELYKHKISQQESLSKELRKQQKNVKSNAEDYVEQRGLFESLLVLLQCKIKTTGKAAQIAAEDEKLLNNDADIAQFDFGGANVMTLES